MQKFDYIIVGQGLAGSVLAHQLMQNDCKVMVVDSEPESTSSKIAAGLCNPIVFKRLTKSWLIDTILPKAKTFYRNQEQLLGEEYFHEVPIYKLFVDQEEQRFWQQKSNEPDLFDWLNPKIDYPFGDLVSHPHGAAHVQQSAFLHTEKWLNTYREFLKNKKAYMNANFNHSDIEFTENGVVWNEIEANKIVFCEGYKCTQNPFFNWLPFKLTKGETLTINFRKLELNAAINKGAFVLPYGEHYKIGATYDWDNLIEETTEKGREELLHKLGKFIRDEITVVKQEAGIRPTVKDRRPLLGVHPKHPQLAVFNGMGTKGVLYAPHLAGVFINYLEKGIDLPKEMDIKRFEN